jgi:hypothetical protein
MTFFSSGVIGFGADAATVAEAIPNPFIFSCKPMASRAARSASQCQKQDRMVVAHTLRWIKLR